MAKAKQSLIYHFIFTPTHRKRLLESHAIATQCAALMRSIAHQKGFEIDTLAIKEDHAHIFVRGTTALTPARIAFFLKWFTSVSLRRDIPWLKQQHAKHLWGRHYFVRTVGNDEQIVRQYINRQTRGGKLY